MNKLLMSPTLLFLLVLSTCISCKDEEASPAAVAVPSKQEILTQGVWAGSSVWFQGEDISNSFTENTGIDFTKNFQNFERNGIYVESYQGKNENGTWAVVENESKILFDEGTPDELLVNIIRLNENELIYRFSNGSEFRFIR